MIARDVFTTGGGTLGPYQVTQLEAVDSKRETIAFNFKGTWDGATATLYECNDLSRSPQEWAPMQDGQFMNDVAENIELPSGAGFKVVISAGTSSPETLSLTCSFLGQFQSP